MHGSGEEVCHNLGMLGICLKTGNRTQKRDWNVKAIRPRVLHSRWRSGPLLTFHYTVEGLYDFDPIFEPLKVLILKFS